MKTAFLTVLDIFPFDHLRSSSLQSDAGHLKDPPTFSVLLESKPDEMEQTDF